jgi:hypothetical protein
LINRLQTWTISPILSPIACLQNPPDKITILRSSGVLSVRTPVWTPTTICCKTAMMDGQMTYAAYHRDRPPPQLSWHKSSTSALASVSPLVKYSSGPAFFGFVSDELQADLASRQAEPHRQQHSAAQPSPPTQKRSYTSAARMTVKEAAAQAVKNAAKRVKAQKPSKVASPAAASEVLCNPHLVFLFAIHTSLAFSLNSLQP